jgi:hypothetical protein
MGLAGGGKALVSVSDVFQGVPVRISVLNDY